MASSTSPGSIVTPNTKAPIPPAYAGLADAPVFGRMASRPDRINNEAIPFFNAWRARIDSSLTINDKSGKAFPASQVFRIGSARRRALQAADTVASPSSTATSSAATGSAVATSKKP